MNIRSIKKASKKRVRNKLMNNILVSFLVTILLAGGYKYQTSFSKISNIYNSILSKSNFNVIDSFINNCFHSSIWENIVNYSPTRGVLSVFFNQITGTGSLFIGIINSFNQLIFNKDLSSSFILFISLIFFVLFYLFVTNILLVGKCRYYLEHNKYNKVSMDKVLFVYKKKSLFNVFIVMTYKTIYSIVWYLTIIGGFIKHYEYMFIPYILAENPKVDKNKAFKVAKEMTTNNKFNLFKLDISLISYYILGLLSFGITNIFYFYPYRDTLKAKMYMELRSKIKDKYQDVFKDVYLEGDVVNTYYPEDSYFIKYSDSKKYKINYNKDYTLINYILLFFGFCIFGWLFEVGLSFYTYGRFINRGTMHGPWIPIYGFGGIAILVLLKRFRDNPKKLYIFSFILCGILEFFASLFLEKLNGQRWWDYTGYFINLNGRICLEGLIIFGLGGCLFTYFLAPLLDKLYNLLSKKIKIILLIILVFTYSIDFIYSFNNPNYGEGITTVDIDK